MTLEQIAQKHGWQLATVQPDKHYTRFTNGVKIIDVWHTNTVRVIHEPFGKVEHFRDNTDEQIEKIFQNV